MEGMSLGEENTGLPDFFSTPNAPKQPQGNQLPDFFSTETQVRTLFIYFLNDY